jgi:CheY-like chemotaxis protein
MFTKKKSPVDPVKDRISRYLRTADKLVRQNKYNEALSEIESAFKLDPKNMYVRSFLERTRHLIQKESEKRTNVFGETETNIDRRTQNVSQLLATAEEFIKVKLYHRALAVIAKVYQIDPKNHFAQLYSERIEELMQAESAGKGNVDFKPPQPNEPEVLSPPAATKPRTPVQDNIPKPTVPIQDTPSSRPAHVQDDTRRQSIENQTPLPLQNSEPLEEISHFALYRELLRECWADGVITPEESAMLHRVRTQSSISFEDHCRLEADIKMNAYVDALRIVWQDGVVTDNEQEVLDVMRKKFGITPEDQAAAEKKFSLIRTSQETKETILIVDPDQDDLISIARALIGRGFDVRVARHPDEAMLFMKTNTPDLILSEVVFPQVETDGFEFFERIRLNKQWNHIPFLMMTYPGDTRIVKAGLRMGVDYFLPKPLHIDFMVAIVEGKLKSEH